mmetsp:Transcript_38150/g.75050  ORF Transcript_38150/g.75050 Transcript_38150/m.75050 type:complete len:977 (+) Transcript_38150:37-2967(+)|eukprot:CAMPEP_0175140316 /NCGR_PEP_ID=MMETSP0087-20121206/11400_1 /TAXON_ID=136419 /ORGANISM="Unknown Unknown, Strain D1" /LENGTH=976 /DNA_ID=CAMNT_0016423443 /DNA_START=31 /DNA_END=2961 /DNA_ORIENTATION=-
MNIVKGQGLPDFVMLERIDEDAFMKNLQDRFKQKQIYTYIGEQVVAMNPFQSMGDLYGQTRMNEYRNRELYEVQPHIYALGDDTFRNLMRSRHDQCVLITGESGAGKTEASKIFMQYIVHVSNTKKSSDDSKGDNIKERLLDSNPVLEAFGNARTIRNDNSSRFGKYMEIQFNGNGAPLGGKISQYLLEKSRVVTRAEDERSFHVFYQLLSEKSLLSGVQLQADPSQYRCLACSGRFKVNGLNDSAEFMEVRSAMQSLGFSQADEQSIWKVIAAILHISNIDFDQDATDRSSVSASSSQLISTVSGLLQVTPDALTKALTTNIIETVGKKTEIFLNAEQAANSRDTCCKALYDKLFSWVVNKINQSLEIAGDTPEMVIGVLDIYGFEIFETNSFEQFCINYCNEKLQQLFIRLVLEQEQQEYLREGIEWTEIEYFNNAPIVALFEGPPAGIFGSLDEAGQVGKITTDELLLKMNQTFKSNDFYFSWDTGKNKDIARDAFRIQHYAGVVDYKITDFLSRNVDTLYRTIKDMVQSSSNSLVKVMIPQEASGGRSKRPVSAGKQFKTNVNDLVKKLGACQPHYIRCIKSNDVRGAFKFDEERIRHQVRYLNLTETVRVRRAGFCNRQPFVRFLARYKMISAQTWPAWGGSDKDGTKIILEACGIKSDEYRLGKTKLFVKNASTLTVLETNRDQHMPKVAIVIQRTWRKLHVKGKALRYMLELCRQYKKGSGNPNYGYDSPVPAPTTLNQYEGLTRKGLENWWLAARVMAMSPECQAVMRAKTQTYRIFGGKKPYDCTQQFSGKYCSGGKWDSVPTKLEAAGEKLVFASLCKRVNNSRKAQPRAVVLTDKALYRYSANGGKQKHRVGLENVLSVHMSPNTDCYVVLKMKPPHYDYVMDLGSDGVNRLAEFVTLAVKYTNRTQGQGNRGGVEVSIAASFAYNATRTPSKPGKDITITFAPGAKKGLGDWKKKGSGVEVLYP